MATKKSRTRKPAKAAKRAKRKPAARKSATRKSATRKSATRKSAKRKSGGRTSATKSREARPKRSRRVLAAVESTARQGFGVARAGFERLKESTTTLIGDVKERITGTDESPPDTRLAEENGGPRG